jgi:adenylate cyclase
MTTVSDLIYHLSGQHEVAFGKKAPTTMKMYLRERGQGEWAVMGICPELIDLDRLLLPSEKPLAIQSRRFQQAGFTEAEHLESLGAEDFSMLCNFIYQTPILPVSDPVSVYWGYADNVG